MGRAAARIKTYQERKLLTTLDNDILLCYIITMMSDPYSEMTPEDHADLNDWLDERDSETQRLLDQVCEGVEVPEEDFECEQDLELI